MQRGSQNITMLKECSLKMFVRTTASVALNTEAKTEFLNLHCDCQLPSSCSMAHFTPFEVGQVKAHLHHGLGPGDIAKIIYKPDGKNRYSHSGREYHCEAGRR